MADIFLCNIFFSWLKELRWLFNQVCVVKADLVVSGQFWLLHRNITHHTFSTRGLCTSREVKWSQTKHGSLIIILTWKKLNSFKFRRKSASALFLIFRLAFRWCWAVEVKRRDDRRSSTWRWMEGESGGKQRAKWPRQQRETVGERRTQRRRDERKPTFPTFLSWMSRWRSPEHEPSAKTVQRSIVSQQRKIPTGSQVTLVWH